MTAQLLAEDEKMLRGLLATCPDVDEEERFNARAFQDMLDRGYALSDKQRQWVRGVYEKIFDEPQCLNLWSSGRVPRGREVPTPAVLQNLPKRPPGAR